MAGFRKRTYANAFKSKSGFRKKRKTFKRKGNKSTNYTSKSGTGRSLGYRAKKLSGKSWRNKLWNDTLTDIHYRSETAYQGVVSSNASPLVENIARLGAVDNSFWTPLGGCKQVDESDPIPGFAGKMVIRGGKLGLRMFNRGSAVPLNVKIWLTRDSRTPNYSALLGTQNLGFDLSEIYEFKKRFGSILFKKEFLLEPLMQSQVEYRLGVQKVDLQEWVNGSNYQWWIAVSDPDTVLSSSCDLISYFNLSFSAEAK